MPEKLVRDRIPEIVAAKGECETFRQAKPDEMYALLRKKLDEEIAEFDAASSSEDRRYELVDILTVIRALSLTAEVGFKPYELDGRCISEETTRGAFNAGWVLITGDQPAPR